MEEEVPEVMMKSRSEREGEMLNIIRKKEEYLKGNASNGDQRYQ